MSAPRYQDQRAGICLYSLHQNIFENSLYISYVQCPTGINYCYLLQFILVEILYNIEEFQRLSIVSY